MIPELLKQQFNMRTVTGVARGDFVMAYGYPCMVVELKYVRGENGDRDTINIKCRDIFKHDYHCLQTQNSAEKFMVFTPEIRDHRVLYVDDTGLLTDTEDEMFSTGGDRGAVPGNIITTLAGPVCLSNRWAYNRVIQKIESGLPIDPEEILREEIVMTGAEC